MMSDTSKVQLTRPCHLKPKLSAKLLESSQRVGIINASAQEALRVRLVVRKLRKSLACPVPILRSQS